MSSGHHAHTKKWQCDRKTGNAVTNFSASAGINREFRICARLSGQVVKRVFRIPLAIFARVIRAIDSALMLSVLVFVRLAIEL
jgi:hypothetical protein